MADAALNKKENIFCDIWRLWKGITKPPGLTVEDIDKQVQESPLTKDESKAQFVKMTEELGIKHSFSFDEAWEIGEELRSRKAFRDKIVEFESQLSISPTVMTKEEMEKANPVWHSLADGCYIREIFNPAGEVLVTKIHKKEHPFFLLKGKMSILEEGGVKHLEGPCYGITKVGTKRIIYTHTDCTFVTVHATEHTDIEKIEEEVFTEDFSDPVVSLHDINKLKPQEL